jgi:hypothetical protein
MACERPDALLLDPDPFLVNRHQRGSTIITRQVPVEHWHEIITDPTLS